MNKEEIGNWAIVGRINGKRGGRFQGRLEDNTPIFGGSNLLYAPIWWEKSFETVQKFCETIIADYPNCEAKPKKLSD